MPQSNFEISYQLEVSKHPTDPTKILVQPTVLAKFNEKVEAAPQHVIFVIDKSGSMGFMDGASLDKLTLVKQATVRVIKEGLKLQDSFSVIAFDNRAVVIVNNASKNNPDLEKEIDAINNITLGGGTSIEAGLKLIGTQIKVTDSTNCRIVLLTDGENGKTISAKKEVEDLCARLHLTPAPTIIPVGIGVGYNETLLKEFGEETHFKSTVHIKDGDDVAQGFDAVANFLGQRTEPINLTVQIDSNVYPCNIGTVSNDAPGVRVLMLDVPQQEQINVKVLNNIGTDLVSVKINKTELPLNRDIVARFVGERIIEINQDKKKSNEDKIVLLQRKILPLLLPEYHTDSQLVKDVRTLILGTIKANMENNENDLRSLTYTTSMATSYGYSTTYGMQNTQTGFKKEVPSFDSTTETVTIGKSVYKVLGQKIDFTEITVPSLLVSIDRTLSQREAILINTNSPALKKLQSELATQIKSEDKDVKKRLNCLATFAANVFQDSKVASLVKKTESFLEMKEFQLACVDLDTFIGAKKGNCRHEAPLTCLLTADLVKTKQLPPGTVRQYRSTAANGVLAHVWTLYHPKDNSGLYLIDPSSPNQKVYNLKSKMDFHLARFDFAERGLEGILDELLAERKLLKPQDETSISEAWLDEIKDEADFKQAGLIDPFSRDVMKQPVRIKGQPKNHVFDYDSIMEWFKSHDTNPITNLKCEKILLPAPDVRRTIVELIAKQNRKKITEGEPVISVKRMKKINDKRAKHIQKGIERLTSSKQFSQNKETEDPIKLPNTDKHENSKEEEGAQQQNSNEDKKLKEGTKSQANEMPYEEEKSQEEVDQQKQNKEQRRKEEQIKREFEIFEQEERKKIAEEKLKPEQKKHAKEEKRKQSFAKKVISLKSAIDEMNQYGIQLKANGASVKGQKVIDLAIKLSDKVDELKDSMTKQEFIDFKKSFNRLLNSENKSFSQYRGNWNTIRNNILIGATGIGLFVIVGKVIYSKVKEGRALTFFQQKETNRERKRDAVSEKLNLIKFKYLGK